MTETSNIDETKIAWLAGLIDGEGSVGACRSGRGTIVGSVQMSMTSERTVAECLSLLERMGVTAVSHHHQERDPEKHQDAHYWRVSRWSDLITVCEKILPHCVTKREHVELLLALARSRMEGQDLDAGGRIASRSRKPYKPSEHDLQQKLARLNLRGAAAVARATEVRFPDEPIERIEWRDASKLLANSWNPNVVFSPELRLLERSILLTGWVQPILIAPDGTIIDGFHRAMLSRESAALRARYDGEVPCAVLDVPRDKAMILTIRMNRAKGTHVAVRMSEIVRELIDVHHCDPQEVAIEIGATKDEIELLYQEGVFKKKNIEGYRYSRAWYPAEKRAGV